MKRIISLIILLFSVSLFFMFYDHAQDSFHYSEMMTAETAYRQIQAERTESGRELVSALRFNQTPLFFDQPGSRWFYSVDPASAVSDPTVEFKAADEKVRLAFSGEIKAGASVPFIAFTDKEYKAYSLVVTTLPLIRIECESDYPTGIEVEDIHRMRFSLYDNRPGSRYPFVQSEGTIHIRGVGSRFYDKKGFRLTLEEKGTGREIIENQVPLLGLRADGDWILYAAYNDQEKIRNVFSSNLWMESCGDDNSFGLKNGMEYRFTELFWNDQYCGLYALGYPVDAKQMGIRPDVTGHYDEFLFKQRHWGPKTEGPNPDYDGIILQFEAADSDVNNAIAITKLYYSMLEAGAPNGLWNNDEKNALDIWLFVRLIQGQDTVNEEGKLRNMFLTIKRSDTGFKILYTPWDMDISWGNRINSYSRETYPYAIDPDDNSYEMAVNPVSVLRKSDPNVVRLIRQRYAELRAGGWSDRKIDEMIDGFEQDIYGSGAYLRDLDRWPGSAGQDPELKLSRFREYVHKRLDSMDKYINEPETE